MSLRSGSSSPWAHWTINRPRVHKSLGSFATFITPRCPIAASLYAVLFTTRRSPTAPYVGIECPPFLKSAETKWSTFPAFFCSIFQSADGFKVDKKKLVSRA